MLVKSVTEMVVKQATWKHQKLYVAVSVVSSTFSLKALRQTAINQRRDSPPHFNQCLTFHCLMTTLENETSHRGSLSFGGLFVCLNSATLVRYSWADGGHKSDTAPQRTTWLASFLTSERVFLLEPRISVEKLSCRTTAWKSANPAMPSNQLLTVKVPFFNRGNYFLLGE